MQAVRDDDVARLGTSSSAPAAVFGFLAHMTDHRAAAVTLPPQTAGLPS
jgi:hypothetical protein